jgi:hypothetical protein
MKKSHPFRLAQYPAILDPSSEWSFPLSIQVENIQRYLRSVRTNQDLFNTLLFRLNLQAYLSFIFQFFAKNIVEPARSHSGYPNLRSLPLEMISSFVVTGLPS